MTTSSRKVPATAEPHQLDSPSVQLSHLHNAQRVNMWVLLVMVVAMLVAGMFIWARP